LHIFATGDKTVRQDEYRTIIDIDFDPARPVLDELRAWLDEALLPGNLNKDQVRIG